MAGRVAPRAAIFDLDGTLADTFAHLADCFATALAPRLGRRLVPAEVYATFGPGAGTEVAILAAFAGGPHPDVVERFFECYELEHAQRVRLFPGIAELLCIARERGVRLGVLTGKGRRATEITLRALGVLHLLDVVVSGEEAPRPKPDPRGLLLALSRLDATPAEAIFVGDSTADVGAGRAAGVATVLARWNGESPELRAAAGLCPDHVADHVSELYPLLGLTLASGRPSGGMGYG